MIISRKKSAPILSPEPLSANECTVSISPHLSMPERGPKCKLGYYRLFRLILWVLYRRMHMHAFPQACS